MELNEKKVYIIKLLMWIWLIEEKINLIAQDLDKKDDNTIDEIIIKLESYYMEQNLIDKEFIKNLDKINNKIDESVENIIENFNTDNFNF